MKIGEFAERYGVTERTLRYYDTIGLLKPDQTDPFSGYRTYSEENGRRMKQILFYRELEFPLNVIRSILDDPDYDAAFALKEQKRLLFMKKERLEKLILLLEQKENGKEETEMIGNEYEKEREKFENEARQRWGGTEAYREYEGRQRRLSDTEKATAQNALEEVFRDFGRAAGENCDPGEPRLYELVRRLQNCISENYYTCTDEILRGLGSMYVGDERFRKNLNRYGEGTAELMSAAIGAYLESKE